MVDTSLRFILIFGVFFFHTLTLYANINVPEKLTFSIFKEGEKIGQETVTFKKMDDIVQVDVATQTDVNVLFLKFHYDHKRQEVWQGDLFKSMTTDTDDDGSLHKIAMMRQADGEIKLQADKGEQTVSSNSLPLTLWTKSVTQVNEVYSVVNGEAWKVSTLRVGSEEILIQGKPIMAEHYRMSGDIERELWYGKDGILLKTKFKKKGFDIEFIKE